MLILRNILVGTSVKCPEELKFLYESHEDFSTLPTYFVLPGMAAMFSSVDAFENVVPGKPISVTQILHGEQYLEIISNPPQEGTLLSKGKVVEVLDKGSGAVIVQEGLFG